MVRPVALLAVLVLAACGGGDEGSGGRLGTGVGAVADPTGRADYLLDFGVAPVGGERRRPWLLANEGPEDLEATVGWVALPFALEGDPVRTVPAASRAEVFFAFRPAAEGDAEAVVEIWADGGGYRLRLVGRGTPSRLSCAPAGLAFGEVAVGETLRRTVTCENRGELSETVVVRSIDGPSVFSWDLPEVGETRVLGPGEQFVIAVDFAPRAAGPYQASFAVEREDGGPVATVVLTGTGR
jgi:hypothetical protein